MSTISTILRTVRQLFNENITTWGDVANGIFDRFEESVNGSAYLTTTGGPLTLSLATDGSQDESRFAVLQISGVLTSNANIITLAGDKSYVFINQTTGPFTCGIQSGAGGAVFNVPQGCACYLRSTSLGTIIPLAPPVALNGQVQLQNGVVQFTNLDAALQTLINSIQTTASGAAALAASAMAAANAAANTSLPLAGGTMSGVINMAGNKITNGPTPTAAGDIVNKNYADTTFVTQAQLQTAGSLRPASPLPGVTFVDTSNVVPQVDLCVSDGTTTVWVQII